METPLLTPLKIGFWGIRNEYCRIIESHSRHFYALALLFLLPSSIFLSVYIFISILIFTDFYSYPFVDIFLSRFCTIAIESLERNPPIKPLIISLLSTLPVTIFFLLATASITHSIFHGLYGGRPINLVSAIKPAFSSFFPLLSTCFAHQLVISGISLILGLFFFSLIKLGFQVINSSLSLVYVTILVFIVVYLQVIWIFAYIVVVVESRWGFEALKRSQNLVKGMEGVAFKIVLISGFLISSNIWRSIIDFQILYFDLYSVVDIDWKSWPFLSYIFSTFLINTVFMLAYLVSNTILYVHSKVQHGEVAEDFATKYASLPNLQNGKQRFFYFIYVCFILFAYFMIDFYIY